MPDKINIKININILYTEIKLNILFFDYILYEIILIVFHVLFISFIFNGEIISYNPSTYSIINNNHII